MPTQQVGLLGKLQKMTTGTVKDVIKVIGDDQWSELTSTIKKAHVGFSYADPLIEEIERIGRDKFLNSKYYVPIDEVGSPRLRRVLQQYGVTVTLSCPKVVSYERYLFGFIQSTSPQL